MTCTVPGADDAMLNDQSASFRDMLHLRSQLRVRAAPAFEAWLERMEMKARHGRIKQFSPPAARLLALTASRTRRGVRERTAESPGRTQGWSDRLGRDVA